MKVIEFGLGKRVANATNDILKTIDKYDFTCEEAKVVFQALVNEVESYLIQYPDEADMLFCPKIER